MDWANRTLIMATLLATTALATPAMAQQDDAALDALAAESAPTPAQAIATAHAQRDSGDLLGAISTLERALLAQPNANDARLVYAAMLCRVGDDKGATVEIAKLDGQDTGNAAWAEVAEACGARFARPTPTAGQARRGVSGEIYGGLAMDTNASGAIQHETAFGSSNNRHQDGLSLIGGGRLTLRSPDYSRSGGFYAGLSGAAKQDIAGPDQRYLTGETRAGYGRDGDGLGYGIGGVARYSLILGEKYNHELGGQAELLWGRPEQRLHLRGELVAQRYADLYPTRQANGHHAELSAALEGRVGTGGYYVAGVGVERKSARARALGYDGARAFAALQRSAGGARYWNVSGSLRYLDFHNQEFVGDRKDLRASARAAYGIPLTSRGLFLEGGLGYTYRRPKVDGASLFTPSFSTYRNVGFDTRLIYKF